ncbi:MAG: hypothetical protein IPJ65_36580 [Archangiaceae bacterium]|nr:hypothetical protein [Archangiaceae bacterium]
MRTFVLAALAVAAAACGPGKPGPQSNVTYFWKIETSTVAFNDNCTDDPKFRMDNAPLSASVDEDANHNGLLDTGEDTNMNGKLDQISYFLVYKASADAKKATLMSCTQLDESTCMPDEHNVVFDVATTELSYNSESKTPTGVGGCNILDTTSWLLTDKGNALDVEISDTFSLVDDPPTCDTLEANAKARSGNGRGFQGCTVSFQLTTSAWR